MQRDSNNNLSLRLKQCVLPVVAATLAAYIGVKAPSGSVGSVLTEVLH